MKVLLFLINRNKKQEQSLLKTFAHSASCNNPKCHPVCHLFKRARAHITSPKLSHSCHISLIYKVLVRWHLNSCEDNDCGLVGCSVVRNIIERISMIDDGIGPSTMYTELSKQISKVE